MKEWIETAVILAAGSLAILLGLFLVIRPKSAMRILGQYRGDQEELTALPGWKPAFALTLRVMGLFAALMGAVVVMSQVLLLGALQAMRQAGSGPATTRVPLLSWGIDIAPVVIGLYLLARPQDTIALIARVKAYDRIEEGDAVQARVAVRLVATMLLLGGLLRLRMHW